MRCAPARPVHACFVRSCCRVVVQEHDLRDHVAAQRQANLFFWLHTALFTPRTSHFTLRTSHSTLHLISIHENSCHLISALLISSHFFSHVIQVSSSQLFSHLIRALSNLSHLLEVRLNSTHLSCSARQKALTLREKSVAQKTIGRGKLLYTDTWDTEAFRQKSLSEILCATKLAQSTLHYKACTKYFPVLLCTTKLAQSTSQHYFVLQSLHKACTMHVPVLLCTKNLAQNTSQYYFLLQSLHKVRPSTTSYYKACTQHVPVLLRTTKPAHSTSQYYFVLQSLHTARPSTTLLYKAWPEYFPVLLRTTKLAQSTSQYYFLLQSLHTACPVIAAPKLDLGAKACKNTILKLFLNEIFKTKITSAKIDKNLLTNHYRNLDAATPIYIPIYDSQL